MNWLKSLPGRQPVAPPRSVGMFGLADSGKTTILYRLKLDEKIRTVSTIGFNFETVWTPSDNVLDVRDFGGQERVRPLWVHYFEDCEGFIFVVDGSDRNLLHAASEELNRVLNDNRIRGVPFLLLVNKSDLPSFVGLSAVVNALEMERVVDRLWHVHACSAERGEGIDEAFDELARMMKYFRRQ